MLTSSQPLQEFFWDDILEFIEEGKVIPIVGAELLSVPDGNGGDIPLQRLLAEKLAERLRVPAESCTGDDALHQVVWQAPSWAEIDAGEKADSGNSAAR